MGFALKASPSRSCALRLSRPAVGAAMAAVLPKRLVLRTVTAAAAAAVGSLDQPGRRMVPTTPRVPAALLVPVANRRSLSVAQTTAGNPDLATTAEALRLLDACGADIIEPGMPFTDPYAEGPVIRASAARALAGGASVDLVLSMLKEVTRELSCPVVILSYFNPIARRGSRSFTAAAKDAGVRGVIVPDLPYAETCVLSNEAAKNNIYRAGLLTTPSTKSKRMKAITVASEGFVYLVSINGVTGARLDVNPRAKDLLKEIKQVTNKAVAVGFGISTPDHVRQVAQWGADGVIIGRAMVKQLGEADSPREGLKRLEAYARSLKDALP